MIAHIALVLGVFISGGSAPPSADKGEALFAQCLATYKALKSYKDTGLAEVRYFNGGGKLKKIPFETRFVRGKGFLFAFTEPDDYGGADNRQAIWTRAGAFVYWQSADNKDRQTDTGGALFFVNGPSGSVAGRVPHFLQVPGLANPIPKTKGAHLEAEESIGGHPCYRIRLSKLSQYWIDKSSHLLLKVLQEPSDEDLIGRTFSITYEPEPNPQLKASDLTPVKHIPGSA